MIVAGRGPAPKDPDKRARRNADPVPMKVLRGGKGQQPELPEFMAYEIAWRDDPESGDSVPHEVGVPWPEISRSWWEKWRTSPLTADLTEMDWEFLLDTAVLHAKYWRGNTSVAGELRLRVAKFGATPEDRARLRITFASADGAEEKKQGSTPKTGGARDRRGPWVPGRESAGGA